MNRYAIDLMNTQIAAGNQVFGLFPGGTFFRQNSAAIKKKGFCTGIYTYELVGGAPISLLEGIRNPQMILMQKHTLSKEKIVKFCDEVKPDVFHIHTWMGFPKELLSVLHKQGCRIIFTAHDYFGICPKVNFIKPDGSLCVSPCNEACTKCNFSAPSETYLRLRNISYLFKIKKYLIPLQKKLVFPSASVSCDTTPASFFDYLSLQKYYHDLLKTCDVIHFNSEVTKKVYMRYFPDLRGIVLPITHRMIMDHRTEKQIDSTLVRLCFIGSLASYKGFPLLKSVLLQLREEGIRNWLLDVWGDETTRRDTAIPNIVYHGSFTPPEEKKVFQNTDLLVVPSIWFETFGFIVAEALSFGVPVLCSDTVGAQCLVAPDMVYHGKDGMKQSLIRILQDPVSLVEHRRKICSPETKILMMDEHEKKIRELYYEKRII